MASDRNPVCFTCEKPISDGPEINRMDDGQPCPACRDRILDALPPLLPNLGGGYEVEVPAEDTGGPDDPIGA